MKNFVFDLGAVLLQWNPDAIVSRFTEDPILQQQLHQEIFQHPDWLQMDRGQLSEALAIQRGADRVALPEQDIADLFKVVRESLTLIPETLQFLEEARDKGFDLYCLSNMSPDNYHYVKQKHAFFDLFKGIVVSGLENTLKPENEIYQILLQRYSLDPAESLFIDDREENTETARTLGFSTITFSATSECYSRIQFYLEN